MPEKVNSFRLAGLELNDKPESPALACLVTDLTPAPDTFS